jgi:hypothetical protein
MLLVLAATAVVLVMSSRAWAWGAFHAGYTHFGPGGAYHVGRTVGVGPYGGFHYGGVYGGVGYRGYYGGLPAYRGITYYGDPYAGYYYAPSYYTGYPYGGFYGAGYRAGVYRAW